MDYQFIVLDSLFLWETSAPGVIFRILQAFHAGSKDEVPAVEFNVGTYLFPDKEYPEGPLLGHIIGIVAIEEGWQRWRPRYRAVVCIWISPYHPGKAIVLTNTLHNEKNALWRQLDFGDYSSLMEDVFKGTNL